MSEGSERFATDDGNHVAKYSTTLERTMRASAETIYDAWVNHFDTWFASPGELAMTPVVGQPFWFSVQHEGEHFAHYGRFMALVEGRLIEHTWVSGRNGTDGAETTVRIELFPLASGSQLRLTHSGFYNETAAHAHGASWPQILEHLDATIKGSV
jgi:uncharacterized protein YndB with AHSA1/START domain